MLTQVAFGVALAGASLASAVAALLVAHCLRLGRRSSGDAGLFQEQDDDIAFLFEDETLVDATDAAHALIAEGRQGASPWERLSEWLAPRIPDFVTRIARLAEEGRLEMHGDGRITLRAEWRQGLARIVLTDAESEGGVVAVDRLSHRAAEDDMRDMRSLLRNAPAPVWRESAAGDVVWANSAYLDLASRARDAAESLTWPLPRLFGRAPEEREAASLSRRISVDTEDGERWFDCSWSEADSDSLQGYALPADDAVRAHTAFRDLKKTLIRTFAELPVGVAIFDRRRRLQLFNPALTDLTTLGGDFLAARPTLEEFFDALREKRSLPEPKDYRRWRASLTQVDRAAAEGHFEETWSLPGGQTYRVTGRPHTDGAVAFLIEDVSAEVSLTRHFRSELRMGQAVLDALEDAVAVFSPAGTLVLTNAAYVELWGEDLEELPGKCRIAEAVMCWKKGAFPGTEWAQLQSLVVADGARGRRQERVHLRDGRQLMCRVQPLAGGGTLVRFSALRVWRDDGDCDAGRRSEAGLEPRPAANG